MHHFDPGYLNDESIDEDKSFSKYVAASFLYKPFVPLPDLSDYLQQLIEVKNYNHQFII
jgi:hypothetical protein